MKKIYVDDVGKGFPLVLVHGYLGSSEMWCHQKDYFSKFCRVITPAIPGFGESSNSISFDSIKNMALKKHEKNNNFLNVKYYTLTICLRKIFIQNGLKKLKSFATVN